MRKNLYNELIFSIYDYKDDWEAMWQDIIGTLQLLFKHGYIAKVYPDSGEPDIIVIQYNYFDKTKCSGTCLWISWEDEHLITGTNI